MTDPKENEEINEELSTDELKSVSGGFDADVIVKGASGTLGVMLMAACAVWISRMGTGQVLG